MTNARFLSILILFVAVFSWPSAAQSAAQHITQYSLPADKLAKAAALYHIEVTMFILGLCANFLILIALLYFRIGARLRDLVERVSRRFSLQAFLFFILLLLIFSVLSLPQRIYGHHISLAYGLSVQSWTSWLGDFSKSTLLTLLIGAFIGFGAYALMHRSPRRWWLWFWVISIPFTLFTVWILPLVIDPIFNKFSPLEQASPQLVAELGRVARRGGLEIPPSRMFEMKASEKVTTYNAYVTGIGSSKRIVVWDTTEHDMTTPETLFIFGHEMGHYVLRHIPKGMITSTIGMLLALLIIRTAMMRLTPNAHLGIRAFDDLAGAPLLLLLVTIISTLSMPIDSGISRYFEHQADVYGLEVLHAVVPNSPDVAASSFQKLGEKSLDYPYPSEFYVWLTYSHPSIPSRLRFAQDYRPWDQGKQTEFVH